jgi:hypothetical protein
LIGEEGFGHPTVDIGSTFLARDGRAGLWDKKEHRALREALGPSEALEFGSGEGLGFVWIDDQEGGFGTTQISMLEGTFEVWEATHVLDSELSKLLEDGFAGCGF